MMKLGAKLILISTWLSINGLRKSEKEYLHIGGQIKIIDRY